VGIPVDLSGQIPFGRAARDLSTHRLFENRVAQRPCGLSLALLLPVPRAIDSQPMHPKQTRSSLKKLAFHGAMALTEAFF
jgi:hypothetical protein